MCLDHLDQTCFPHSHLVFVEVVYLVVAPVSDVVVVVVVTVAADVVVDVVAAVGDRSAVDA